VGVKFLALAFLGGDAVSGQSLPEGPGKELVEAICTVCHSTERITQQHMTKLEWQGKVLEMLQEDPDVTQKERDAIVDYLVRSFPKRINVNTAAAKELQEAMELPATDADAIVRYRDKKGSFKTIEELKKVPGLDPEKIEAYRAGLDFQ